MSPEPPSSPTPISSDRLLGWPRVRDRVDISRTTAWRLEQRGEFPQSVQISPGRVAWRESEIDAWKAARCHRPAAEPTRRPGAPKRAQATSPQTQPSPTPAAPSGPPPKPATAPASARTRRTPRTKPPDAQIAFEF